jgi:hypothetical protein
VTVGEPKRGSAPRLALMVADLAATRLLTRPYVAEISGVGARDARVLAQLYVDWKDAKGPVCKSRVKQVIATKK